MTDIDVIRAMLDRAKIPYTETPTKSATFTDQPLPAGATSLEIHGYADYDGRREQPIPNGYFSFYSELAFNEAGDLIGVWAWE